MGCDNDNPSSAFDTCAPSSGTTSASVDTVVSAPMRVKNVKSFRAQLEILANSDNAGSDAAECQRGVEYSNDGVSWDTMVSFDTATDGWMSAPGRYYANEWTDTSNAKKWVRFGLRVRQTTGGGTDIEQLRVRGTIEIDKR